MGGEFQYWLSARFAVIVATLPDFLKDSTMATAEMISAISAYSWSLFFMAR